MVNYPNVDNQTQLLTMCSSKQRPDRLKEMINSFVQTIDNNTKLCIYVSRYDPHIEAYLPILTQFHNSYPFIGYEIGEPKTMIQVLNYFSTTVFPDVSYYSEINDDHICRTKGWDSLMMTAIRERKNDWGIAYGWTQNLPTAIMMSGKLVRAQGHFLHPVFTHLYVDDYIKELGNTLNLWVHLPEVIIEHMHVGFGKAGNDETYQWVYSQEQTLKGQQALQEWREKYRDETITKICEEVIKGHLNV